MIQTPVGWDSLFTSSNKVLKNCNVIVKTNDSSLVAQYDLLDKEHIVSYSYKGRNSYCPLRYPSEDLVIEIIDFDNLTANQQNYLSTVGKAISVYYTVNNLQTVSKKQFIITDFYVDRKSFNAKITAKGLLETLFNGLYGTVVMSGVVNLNNLINPPTYNYKETHHIANGILSTASYYGSYTQFPLPNYFKVRQVPTNKTMAEMLQSLAVVSGSGLTLQQGIWHFQQHDVYSSFYSKAFLVDNIYEDYTLNTEKQEYDTAVVVGYLLNRIEIPNGSNYEVNYGYNQYLDVFNSFIKVNAGDTTAKVVFDKKVLLYTTIQDSYKGDSVLEVIYTQNSNELMFTTSSTSPYTWTVEFTCYEMIEDYTTQADITFSSPLFNKDYDQNEMNYAQAKIRNYYSNKRIIEFECRIDPSIEPLDYITTDGLNYWVEEVDIDFNGGFTGRIKGRVNDNTYFVDAPVISEATLINENNYRIVIDNPNDFAVVVKIYYSGGTLSYNISANGSLLLTYGNASALSTSVQDKIDGGLLEAVYCNFEKQDDTSQTSDNTIILEAD